MPLPDDYQVCPMGCAIWCFQSFRSVCFEPPLEGRDVDFPRKPAILADCTTLNRSYTIAGGRYPRLKPVNNHTGSLRFVWIYFCMSGDHNWAEIHQQIFDDWYWYMIDMHTHACARASAHTHTHAWWFRAQMYMYIYIACKQKRTEVKKKNSQCILIRLCYALSMGTSNVYGLCGSP
jgi:hypothetical protein